MASDRALYARKKATAARLRMEAKAAEQEAREAAARIQTRDDVKEYHADATRAALIELATVVPYMNDADLARAARLMKVPDGALRKVAAKPATLKEAEKRFQKALAVLIS